MLLARFRKQKQIEIKKKRGIPLDQIEKEAENIIMSYVNGAYDIDTAVNMLLKLYPSKSAIPSYFYQMLITRAHQLGALTNDDMIAAKKELISGRDKIKDNWEHIGHPAAIKGKEKAEIQKKTREIEERLKKENNTVKNKDTLDKEVERIVLGYLNGERSIDYAVSMLKHLYPDQARIPQFFYHMLLDRAHKIGRISHCDVVEARHELLTGRDKVKDSWEHIGHPEGVKPKQKKIYRHKMKVLENRLEREQVDDHFCRIPVLPASIANVRTSKRKSNTV